MNTATRKITALVGKDARDLFKNPGMFVSLLLPLAMVAFMAYYLPSNVLGDMAAGPERDAAVAGIGSLLLKTGLAMSVGMVGSMAVLYSLAEEKEKHTLRTLMLSNVSAGQILTAKALVGIVSIAAIAVAGYVAVAYFVPEVGFATLPVFTLLTLVGSVAVVLPSLVLGLACRDQMTASFYAVPVMLAAVAPMVGMYGEGVGRVVRFFPLGGVCELLDMAVTGNFTWGDAVVPVVVTVAWIAVGVVVFKGLYARLSRDN